MNVLLKEMYCCILRTYAWTYSTECVYIEDWNSSVHNCFDEDPLNQPLVCSFRLTVCVGRATDKVLVTQARCDVLVYTRVKEKLGREESVGGVIMAVVIPSLQLLLSLSL